jgi:nucleoside-diphosphate-sugar epimerase
MKILVCGAAGFLGSAVVRACARGGHTVRGGVRSPAQRAQVADAGGEPVVASVLDRGALERAAQGCEAVVHLAQARGSDGPEARAVRVDGASNLRAVASSAGVRRLVVGSGYWVYRSHPGTIVEDSPLEPIGLSRTNFDAERAARAPPASGLEVVVVRPGMVYGDGSWFRSMVEELNAGTYRFVGEGQNRLSPVSLEDTAEAYRRLIEDAPSGSTYLVVDDLPVATADFARYVADRLGARPPQGMPYEEAEATWGRDLARLNAADRAASNARLRALGWRPKFPTFREGLPRVLASMSRTQGSARRDA